MNKNRLDGVITIMVLEFMVPHSAKISDLWPLGRCS
jgi:uncharacterized membrane protein